MGEIPLNSPQASEDKGQVSGGVLGGAKGLNFNLTRVTEGFSNNVKVLGISNKVEEVWQRSSGVREKISAVTKEMASAVTDEIAGAKETVEGALLGTIGDAEEEEEEEDEVEEEAELRVVDKTGWGDDGDDSVADSVAVGRTNKGKEKEEEEEEEEEEDSLKGDVIRGVSAVKTALNGLSVPILSGAAAAAAAAAKASTTGGKDDSRNARKMDNQAEQGQRGGLCAGHGHGDGMQAMGEMEGYKVEIEGLEMEREMLSARVKALEEDNAALKAAVGRGEGGSFEGGVELLAGNGNDGGGEELIELVEQLNVAKDENSRLEAHMLNVAGERDAAVSELASMRSERDAAVGEKDALTASIAQVSSERDALSTSLAQAASEGDYEVQLRQQVASLEQQLQEANDASQAMKKQVMSLEEMLTEAQEGSKVSKAEADQLREQVSSLEMETRGGDREMEGVLANAVKQRDALLGQLDDESKKVLELEAEVAYQSDLAGQAEKGRAQAEERVSMLEADKEEVMRLKAEKEEEVMRLKAEKEEEVMKLKAEKEEEVMRLKAEKEEEVMRLKASVEARREEEEEKIADGGAVPGSEGLVEAAWTALEMCRRRVGRGGDEGGGACRAAVSEIDRIQEMLKKVARQRGVVLPEVPAHGTVQVQGVPAPEVPAHGTVQGIGEGTDPAAVLPTGQVVADATAKEMNGGLVPLSDLLLAQQRAEDAEKALSEAEDDLQQRSGQLEMLKRGAAMAEEMQDRLKEAVTQEVERLRGRIQELEEEAQHHDEEAQRNAEETHKALEEAQQRAEEALGKADEAQKRFENAQQGLAEAEKNCEDAKVRAEEAERALGDVREEMEGVMRELSSSREGGDAEVKRLEGLLEKERAAGLLVDAQNLIAELREKVRGLEDATARARGMPGDLEEEKAKCRALEEQVKSLAAEAEASKSRCQAVEVGAEAMRGELEASERDKGVLKGKAMELEAQVEGLKSEIEQVMSKCKSLEARGEAAASELEAARQGGDAEVASLRLAVSERDAEVDELRFELGEARLALHTATTEAMQRAHAQFEGEIVELKEAMGKLKGLVRSRGVEMEILEESLREREEEIVELKEETKRLAEESAAEDGERDAQEMELKGKCEELEGEVEMLKKRLVALEGERDVAVEERGRIEQMLEAFHDQASAAGDIETQRLKNANQNLAAAASEKDAALADLEIKLASANTELEGLKRSGDAVRAELDAALRSSAEAAGRIGQVEAELRKARMFASSEDHLVDRRLLTNIVVSYFDGQKAGTDEVLKLLCSILDMSPEQFKRVEKGSRRAKGLVYGLLSASASGWDAITEAEIGEEWVKFLLEETEKATKEEKDAGTVAAAAPPLPPVT